MFCDRGCIFESSKLERRRGISTVQRKDCALESLENEVEVLNNKVTLLTNDLSRRRRLSSNDHVQTVLTLEEEKSKIEAELQEARQKLSEAISVTERLQIDNVLLGDENASVKEKLTLAGVILRQKDGVHPSEGFIDAAQQVWKELGVELSHREAVRLQIESCLEDTCSRKLQEESALKESTCAAIASIEGELIAMQRALGLSMDNSHDDNGSMKLLQRLEWLKARRAELQPIFLGASERSHKIAQDAQELVSSMSISTEDLSNDLQSLIRTKTKVAESSSPPSASNSNDQATFDLSNRFLSSCEGELSSLRLQKARVLVKNSEVQNAAHKLVQEMNLSEDEVVAVSVHSVKQRLDGLPSWWNQARLVDAARCVVQGNRVVSASRGFSDHLQMIYDSLSSIAQGRGQLSSVLREIVTRAQKTLLDTVEREIDASEAFTSFHDALFRLPPLSQEFVEVCITEMDALVSGVESMAQSEIEALTVVWEALNVSLRERGKFWSEIDDSTKAMESSTESPFDEVLRICATDKEQWVLTAIKNCRSMYKRLGVRLFKLERIHQQVEKLRARQDTKSKIISLDSELRLLGARLSEFEDKKCNKQRLLTKKSGSSALLKEERFRKQMQGKYTSSLEQLASLLQLWNENEGEVFDHKLLSNEVRVILQNSEGVDNWVEKRTEFMHLRMVQSAVKRKPERPSRLMSPRKPTLKSGFAGTSASPALGRQKVAPSEPSSASKKRKVKDKLGNLFPSKAAKSRKLVGDVLAKSNKTRESITHVPFGKVLSELPEYPTTNNLLEHPTTTKLPEHPKTHKRQSTTVLPFANILSEIPETEN